MEQKALIFGEDVLIKGVPIKTTFIKIKDQLILMK